MPAPPLSGRPDGTAFGAVYVALGVIFGIILVKGEIVSWFRIQEMFRFQAFHMYGVIGSALAVATGSLAWLKRCQATSLNAQPIRLEPKRLGRAYRYWIGGGLFGVGWALTGACPGPLFALLGARVSVITIAIAAALAGTWSYGAVRSRLPHY